MSMEVHVELKIFMLMSHKLRWKLMQLMYFDLVIIHAPVLCYS
jgi:hypothetical protein